VLYDIDSIPDFIPMSHSNPNSLVERLKASNRFDWSKLQQIIQEFSVVAKPALCGIDFFDPERIVRVKMREVIDLPVSLSEEDWEFCFALAEGLRPVGSDAPHWLMELSEGVLSRSTCLAAEPLRDENGLTIGLLYAFFASGTPDELVSAYMRSSAKECSTLIQQWQYSERHQELLTRLWTSIELSCPGFLILDERMRVVQMGSLYSKSIPGLTVGDRFEQHFIWDTATTADEWKQQMAVKSKLRFYHTLEFNQRYKCTVQFIQPDLFLLLANPVVNSNHAMVDYHLTASDFPAHDYITDFVFLQTTTLKSLEEVQRSNEIMQFRNRELELMQSELMRSKLILENKITERNERVVRLSNFPEQNPNPVFEIDYTRQFICFSNRAAKEAFGDLLTLPYPDFLSMLSLSHELVSGSYRLRVEFESGNRYFIADATRVPNEEIMRFYANDASELRQLKTLLFRQQQGLNQLLGVLEALNIDKEEAVRSANLNDVIQEVTKLLGVKNT
jgi:hypothetical protein